MWRIACLIWLNTVALVAVAQPPTTVVAQASWPNPHRITLLIDSCGWPGGAMRAQQILPGRHLRWGCWGYNETGVQVQWEDGRQEWIDYLELFIWEDGWHRQMGYGKLHRRVWHLRNTQ